MGASNLGRAAREVLAAAFLLAAIVWLAVHYSALPIMIHSPFNGGGDARGMGSRDQLWLLLVIGGWMYALMTMFNLLPAEAVNWPRPLTDGERNGMFERAKAFMGWFKAVVMASLFAWIFLLVHRASSNWLH